MKIKIGIGIRSNEPNLIKEANELFETGVLDFAEIFFISGSSIAPFSSLKMPLTMHAPHFGYGVNLADKTKKEFNLKSIKECIDASDKIKAEYVTFHPGEALAGGHYDDAVERSISILSYFKKSKTRICFENVPLKSDYKGTVCIGYKPEDIKKMVTSGFGFCFDLNHACKAAVSLKAPPEEFIKKFIKFNPDYFHISDGRLSSDVDEHLFLGEGGYNIEFMKSLIKGSKSKMVVIETHRKSKISLEENKKDIKFLRNI